MDVEDLAAGICVGEIDPHDIIEAAEKLGAKGADIVGGGDYVNGGFGFLHPGEERAEDAGGGAAV